MPMTLANDTTGLKRVSNPNDPYTRPPRVGPPLSELYRQATVTPIVDESLAEQTVSVDEAVQASEPAQLEETDDQADDPVIDVPVPTTEIVEQPVEKKDAHKQDDKVVVNQRQAKKIK